MDAIERLKAERAALVSRLATIDAVIAEHAALQRKVESLLSMDAKDVVGNPPKAAKSGGESESGIRRVTPEVAAFEQGIRDILRVTPHPLDRNELYAQCLSRNIFVGGKEPLNTLASRMSRMDGVTNVRGQGYFLEDRLIELRQPAYATSGAQQSIAANADADASAITKRVDDESDGVFS